MTRPQLDINEPNPSTYLRNAQAIDRLMFRTSESPDGCWLWRGGLGSDGYGDIGLGGAYGPIAKVHRVSYEHFVGPIPDGLTIDHLCRVRHCVNPEHLEAVTLRENIQRGWAARDTGMCRNGHPMTGDNVMEGKNRCRTCTRARQRAYKDRMRAAA